MSRLRSTAEVRHAAIRDHAGRLDGPCNHCARFLRGCTQDGTEAWREAHLYVLDGVAHVVAGRGGKVMCPQFVALRRFGRSA